MTTAAVTYTVPSNSWTGSVDVTDANLLDDVTVTDYKIFYDGTEQGAAELANWSKASATSLTYSGSSLDMDDVVTIWRNTPDTQVTLPTPVTVIQSSLWNNEFDRVVRRAEEATLFYHSATPASDFVIDTAYSAAWNGVTSQALSANAVYDMMNSTNTHTGDLTFSGTCTLSGSNAYSGAANTFAGALNTFSGTTVTFSGTTVNMGAAVTQTGNITFSGTPTVAGNATVSGVIDLTGSFGGSLLNIDSTTVDVDCTTFDIDATTVDLSGSTTVNVPTVAQATESDNSTKAASTAWVINNPHGLNPGGRLTISTGVPVMSKTSRAQTTSTTLYYTPYIGDFVWLYNTSDTAWRLYNFSELSLDLTSTTPTTDTPYDVFLYDNSGTLTLEQVAWTDYDTRATAIAIQDGMFVQTSAANKLYVGSFCTNTSNTLTFDNRHLSNNSSPTFYMGIANAYNLVEDSCSNYVVTISNFAQTELATELGDNLHMTNGLTNESDIFWTSSGLSTGAAVTAICRTRYFYPSAGITGTVYWSDNSVAEAAIYYGNAHRVTKALHGWTGFNPTLQAAAVITVNNVTGNANWKFTY